MLEESRRLYVRMHVCLYLNVCSDISLVLVRVRASSEGRDMYVYVLNGFLAQNKAR